MTDIEKKIRKNVKDLFPDYVMAHPGLTQEQLAKSLGVCRKTLWLYRNEPQKLTAYTLNKMLCNMNQQETK